MDGVNERNLLSAADDSSSTVSDTSSPAESDTLLKQFETKTKGATSDDLPNLSTQASSVTLAVHDEETAAMVKEGKATSPALGAADPNTASKPIGWPSRTPFHSKTVVNKNGVWVKRKENLVFWSDLTWKQKNAWRKAFLTEYLSETKKCLPFVWKLYAIIYRLSPWRALVLLGVSIFRGFLPALTLQTRGKFIMMAFGQFKRFG
jgi:hypothetical protein